MELLGSLSADKAQMVKIEKKGYLFNLELLIQALTGEKKRL